MAGRLGLVFSGGGAKGAFGVGVLSRIVERFPGLRWHVVTGTSTGALITPLAALGRDDPKALADLRDFYLKARKDDIVDSNFELSEILKDIADLPEGIYNFEPLREIVRKVLPPERLKALANSEVAAVVNAVSLQTGGLVLCTQDRHRPALEAWFEARKGSGTIPPYRFLPFEHFLKGMVASASIPGGIQPVRAWRDPEEQLVDGGVIDIAPLRAAIAAGATDVLAVIMSPRSSPPQDGRLENLLDVALRAVDHLTAEVLRNDVEYAGQVTDLRGLAERLLRERERLPDLTKEWVERHHDHVKKMSERVEVRVEVIEPPMPLGETLDFDSDVKEGWPDAVERGAKKKKVNVMHARFDCGRRAADAAVDREPVRSMLETFSTP
ncbi:MAG TPA: patatin-like phospholipase family protein [Planctomycetota bacterium]|jgi:NTE family protein|nr:patatin-like phospholipase family protein [Planctomycetota bacterium]